MRFLQAILMAMLKLAEGGLMVMDWCWRNFWGLFGGGGGSATPQPLDLPSKDVFEVDRSLEESHQRAANTLSNSSAAMQIKLYASAKADDRYSIDLSKLEPTQQDWLIGLSTNDRAMRLLSAASDSKITMLLTGHDGIIEGIDSPKPEKPRAVLPGLVSRIDDFRLKSSSRERDHILAA